MAIINGNTFASESPIKVRWRQLSPLLNGNRSLLSVEETEIDPLIGATRRTLQWVKVAPPCWPLWPICFQNRRGLQVEVFNVDDLVKPQRTFTVKKAKTKRWKFKYEIRKVLTISTWFMCFFQVRSSWFQVWNSSFVSSLWRSDDVSLDFDFFQINVFRFSCTKIKSSILFFTNIVQPASCSTQYSAFIRWTQIKEDKTFKSRSRSRNRNTLYCLMVGNVARVEMLSARNQIEASH